MIAPVLAYVGPGAGFAFAGSFLALIVSFCLTLASLFTWPFRAVWSLAKRRHSLRRAKVKRVILLGLDGLDPRLTERFMAEGRMPNLSRLRDQGSFHRLRTTFPAMSPVAWSTFATGVSPAKHNIFDFLNRSLQSYLPELAASKVRPSGRWLKVGRFRIPLGRPRVEFRRKSKSFWKLLSEHAIGSTILRVPITFPPEEFDGRMLSAMCTPDLRGTQGSFTYFSTTETGSTVEGGTRRRLHRDGAVLTGVLEGPIDGISGDRPLTAPFRIRREAGADDATLEIAGKSHHLRKGEYSPWIHLSFRVAPGIAVRGIARFLLTETPTDCALYVTPIQIDPEAPALPISHPPYYASYLAKLLGTFATVGMAEDTWALNEGVIDEATFLDQAYSILAEREAMFESALAHTRRGAVACVFDTSDRVQHMFYRHMDGDGDGRWQGVIAELYQRMDRIVGKAMANATRDTALFVLSDHGFCRFRRAVNLNTWLHENGYLVLQAGTAKGGKYFQGVDWARTRAYCLGLGGLYLNLKGREGQGIVQSGQEAAALKQELIERLSGLRDHERGEVAIGHVYATSALYRGPYVDAAPDLIVGYNEGYRVSWDAAVGGLSGHVFEDNDKAWSGDHCVDPTLVPGVLFSSRAIDRTDPGIEDLAPTVLALFGVTPPAWMDGKPLFQQA